MIVRVDLAVILDNKRHLSFVHNVVIVTCWDQLFSHFRNSIISYMGEGETGEGAHRIPPAILFKKF